MFQFIESNECSNEKNLIKDINLTNELLKQSDILNNDKKIKNKIKCFKKEIKELIEYSFIKKSDSVNELDNIKFNTIFGKNNHVYVFELETTKSFFTIFVYDHSIFGENKFDIQIVFEDCNDLKNKDSIHRLKM